MRSIAVFLSLLLGVAGATVVFKILDHTVLPGGMFSAPRVVELMLEDRREGYQIPPSSESLQAWQHTLRCCGALSGFTLTDSFLSGRAGARRIATALVDPNFFEAAGLAPAVGRTFVPSDFRHKEPVALISLVLARTLFGSAHDALGKSLTIEGMPVSIVGVLPAGSELERAIGPSEQIDLVRPLDLTGQDSIQVIAKLRDGISLGQMRAELDAWSRTQPPEVTDGGNIHWIALAPPDRLDSTSRRILEASALGGLLLVLVTASNVGHLLAAQGRSERKRVAIRWALGAARRRLLAWKVKQALFLSLPAGIGAALLAEGTLHVLRSVFPESLRFLIGARVDLGSLLFAVAGSFLSMFLGGVLPTVLRSQASLGSSLTEDPRFGRPSPVGRTLGSVHILSMVAASFVLGVLAYLVVGTILSLRRVDFGFTMDSLEVINIDLPEWKYGEPDKKATFFRRLSGQFAALPGVKDVTLATSAPPESGVFFGKVDFGREIGGVLAPGMIGVSSVGPQYFRTLEQKLLAGRDFNAEDMQVGSAGVVISHSFAKLIAQDPKVVLGRSIRFGDEARTVIGVARDLNTPDFLHTSPIQAYFPLTRYRASMRILVRTAAGTESALRREALKLDPDVAVEARPARALFARSLAMTRFLTAFFLLLSVLVGGLAFLGIYGALSRFVTERRREIALRIALGATRAKVYELIMLRAFSMVLAGVGIGLLASYPVAKLLATQLYGVQSHSVLARVTAALLLFAATFIATIGPMAHASHEEPGEILRRGE